MTRKNVGLRPRLRWTDGDRWVWLSTEPEKYTRCGRGFPVANSANRTGPPARAPSRAGDYSGSSVREDRLTGLLHLDRADAVVELGQVRVDLGVAAVRVARDRACPAVLLVEASHQLRDRRVAQLGVLLEQVLELAREARDRGGGQWIRRRS